jgi:hypothetical protein
MALNEPRRWGSEAQATHCREGEAGYNVSLEGTMGGTPRPQTITTETQGIANKGQQKLCAKRGVACLVSNAVKRIRTEEPDEGNLHVRVCGGSAG